MSTTIDARGLSCPAPVLLAKDTIDKEQPPTLTVIVDNDASRENVGRFLASRNYQVSETARGSEFHLFATAKEGAETGAPVQPATTAVPAAAGKRKILVLVSSDTLGKGDDELGAKLMIAYIKTIKEMGDELWHLVFINSGVKLTIAGSPVLAELQEYERQGVIILACGTCLTHFNLMDVKQVGQTTNMLDIVCATQLADKVIQAG